MLRATSVVRRPAVKAERVADTILLDHEGRHRRRVAMTGEGGLAFLLDLDRAAILDDGDAVKLEDGRLVQVRAAPERLLAIRAETPLRLTKLAWHVGNRHVPAEITADAVYIGFDHVLLEMVRGLGGIAEEVERPFRPESGAYHVHGPECGHDDHAHGDHAAHGHGAHDHSEHDHAAHDHGHAHDHGTHAHEHGHHGHRHG